jgi:uncharacterized glyoxalase superfamily protein PhnB
VNARDTDVEAWWRRISEEGMPERYGVPPDSPTVRPWRMRDFVLHDPSGVLWRIAQKLP